jgi:hypothetical protein
MRHIKSFDSYKLFENAGYGNDYFVNKKEDKTQHYYFKVDDGEKEVGLIFKIGKFSKTGDISDSEKSYGVVHLEKLDPDDMDEYLVNDTDYRSNDDKFSLSSGVLTQAFEIYKEVLDDYLEKNPKVNKFYDEILENLEMTKDEYSDFIFPVIRKWSKRWKIQDGPNQNVLIYTKRTHE